MDTLDFDTERDLGIPEFAPDTEAPDSEADGATPSGDIQRYPPREYRRSSDTPDPVARPGTAPQRSVCLAFQGVGGGAGATSLAIATAHQLGRRARDQVCIVDLDFELGAAAHYLDIGTAPKMDALRVDPSRVDATYVRAMVSHHSSGLAVLGSPGVAHGNDLANPATVIAMLDQLSDMYPVLILDLPRQQRPWVEAAALAADRVALVTELHIPALHLARQTLSRLSNSGVAHTDIVINKYERRSFKASIRVKDAERALGREVSAVVGLDMQAPFEAINCGEPGGRLDADTPYGRDLAGLATALAPDFAEKRQRRSANKSLFRRK